MEKMWAGRFKSELDEAVNDFNSSINVDSEMYKEDIKASIAHATMLGAKKIVDNVDVEKIVCGLENILDDLEKGMLQIDRKAEDIHMFVEAELTKRIGDAGKKLHTARSRNDQVAVDTKLYIKKTIAQLKAELVKLLKTLIKLSKSSKKFIVSGYTHLQKAQPINFAHHLLAYCFMFKRDVERLDDCYNRMNFCPLGAAALAGTTFKIDRQMTAELLGFVAPTDNSMDSVSDRDYLIELANDLSIVMMHLSRFSEEVILWTSNEFKYIELDDSYATGSSIMPQKKNPDIAELVRGKTGRVYGNLITLLTMMKSLPLAYNKDMQEDKEAIFDSIKTVSLCLNMFNDMLLTMKVLDQNMKLSAQNGFINATDCADYLAKKGVPFRTAYKITGELVAYCIDSKKSLNELSIEEYKQKCDVFENDIFDAIDLENCMNKRNSYGGPSQDSIDKQICVLEKFIGGNQ